MGESDRYSDYKPQKHQFILGQAGNPLVSLVTLNIIFFILLITIRLIYFLFQANEIAFNQQVMQYFQLPAQVAKLVLVPWTIFTYMFCQTGVINMLSNMLWLWAFGFIFQELTGNKKIIPVYIYGGLAGALFFILAYYIIPPLKSSVSGAAIMGSNAATMAVATATTMLAPGYRFFRNLGGGIPIWVLLLAYLLIDYAGVATMGAAFSISHLGGAMAGFLFIYLLNRNIDGSIWMNKLYNRLSNLFGPSKMQAQKPIREKVFYNTGNRAPYKKSVNLTQSRVDEILDKINQKGYAQLTDEEKNILKRAAEEDV